MSKQYISASKISQFLYCPFTFELSAAGYEPQEQYMPSVAAGSAFHEGFRYMCMGLPAEEAAEAAVASTEICNGQKFSDEEKQDTLIRLRAIPDWVLKAKDVEVKFEVALPEIATGDIVDEEVVITGFIDAVLEDRIVELKAVSKQKNELPRTYQIQAHIYMYATGIEKTTFFMVGKRGEVRQFDVYKMNKIVVEEMLTYFARSMRQQYKPPTGLTNFSCAKCSFAYVCPFAQTLKQTQNA